jgi:hypothetical protein
LRCDFLFTFSLSYLTSRTFFITMALAKMDCEVPNCTWASAEGTLEQQLQLLVIHNQIAHTALFGREDAAHLVARGKPESLPRPTISEGATEADFTRFQDKWLRYKRSTLAQATPRHVSDQLWACCSPELETSVYNTGANSNTEEYELMEKIKRLAVRRQNPLVNVSQFLDLAQDTEETAGSYMARLKGQASICSFALKCPAPNCIQSVSYSDQMVAHQLVRGLEDPVIQEQVLAQGAENGSMNLDTLIKFIEAKEAGKRSSHLLSSAGGLNRMSEYRKQKNTAHIPSSPASPSQAPLLPPSTCRRCGVAGCKGKTECKAKDKLCSWCQTVGHYERVCMKKKSGKPKKDKEESTTNANFSNEPSTEVGIGNFCSLNISSITPKQKTIAHHEFDPKKGWISKRAESHPILPVSVSVCGDAYTDLCLPPPRTMHRHSKMPALMDTGAQLTVAGPFLLHALGVSEQELTPLSNSVRAANGQSLDLLGGIFITVSGQDSAGDTRVTKQQCYIARNASTLFLSKAGCKDL